MRFFLWALLIVNACLHAENETPYIISLETQAPLLPIYVTAFHAIDPSISENYKTEALKVLQFDLNQSGLLTVLPKKSALDKQAAALKEGKRINVSKSSDAPDYFIIPSIEDGNLYVLIHSVSGDWTKKLSLGALQRDLDRDRLQMHHLSDEVHKLLFGKNGIATTKIIYTLKKEAEKGDWSSEIYEMDYDGAAPRKILSDEGYIVTPQYVPPAKGKKAGSIIYVTYKNGIPKIHFANLETQRTSRFSPMKGNQLMPTVNRDRNKIAFVSDVTGNPDIFVALFDGKIDSSLKPYQLFSAKMGVQGSPVFSPDGSKLAFVSNKDGTPRIYIAEVPDSPEAFKEQTPQLLTKFRRACTAPSWSPDGQKIAYCSPVNGVHQIFCYDFRTQEETQITSGAGEKQNPSFAPNSISLVYNSSNGSESNIYITDLHHKKAVKITSGPGEKRYPHWEPRNF